MLGVTFFGIFLTPVFFYVIEWFVEQPFFASERARLVGKVLLYLVGMLTLGLFWIVPLLLGMALRRSSGKAPAARKQPALIVPVVEPDGDGVATGRAGVLPHVNGPHQSANGNGAPTDGNPDQMLRK
jgi:hypothetical protein